MTADPDGHRLGLLVNDANGTAGVCACGQPAVASCVRCNRPICQRHADEVPDTPSGISADAAGTYTVAVRSTGGPMCQACRAEVGQHALSQALSAPRASLPSDWLDRAIALSGDRSRSDLEKQEDAQLPSTLTPGEVAAEFLRRMEQPPRERVPISASTIMRAPEYVEGWTVDCRRTMYRSRGAGQSRYRLPCLISVHGELLGPVLEAEDKASGTWWIVPDDDIELPRLVSGVANILMLSAFVSKS